MSNANSESSTTKPNDGHGPSKHIPISFDLICQHAMIEEFVDDDVDFEAFVGWFFQSTIRYNAISRGPQALFVHYTPRTRTHHSIAKNAWCTSGLASNRSPQPCRFVSDIVDRDILSFSSALELMTAFKDVVTAHYKAYMKCHVFHRDITPRNILIDHSGKGVLVDWDHTGRNEKPSDEAAK